MYSDDGADAEHIRPEIQSRAGTVRRDPRSVCRHDLLYSVDEFFLRIRRHLEAERAVVHALRVHVRPEADDISVFGLVGLQALEDRLRVLEYARVLAHRDHRVVDKPAFAPRAVLKIRDVALVDRNVAEFEILPVKIFLFHFTQTPFRKRKIKNL